VYRWIDHTSEVEIEIEAGSEREVFEDALSALRDLLGFGSIEDRTERRVVAVGGPDRPALLAAWLEELVYLAESEGFVALRVDELSLPPRIVDNFVDNRLSAVVVGVIDAPPPLVKAVTYHRLAFAPAGAGYGATVVLDV
jgi:SHS2 domain-containing protein